MASISSNKKTSCHARSISLTSTSNHLSQFDEQLCRLHSAEGTSSSVLIAHKLNDLKDLYSSVDNLLLLSTTQRALAQGCQYDLVNELLDELLGLLDLCSTAKDALSMTRDSAQELQSVLRRKRSDNFGLMTAAQEHLSQRKKVKKAIHKAIRDLKSSGVQGSSSINEKQEDAALFTMLKQVESNTFTVFRSILSFILGSKPESSPNGWSLVSKLMGSKNIACVESLERSEVEKADAEILTLISQKAKKSSSIQVEDTLKELTQLESSLQDLEECLECLYRHLIKTRVALLNLLNC